MRNNPLFAWPPRPVEVARWYGAFWLVISTTTLSLSLLVGLLAIWHWAPTLAETERPGPGWIAVIWLGFLIPHSLRAGGLHLWLYRWRGQGITLKYD